MLKFFSEEFSFIIRRTGIELFFRDLSAVSAFFLLSDNLDKAVLAFFEGTSGTTFAWFSNRARFTRAFFLDFYKRKREIKFKHKAKNETCTPEQNQDYLNARSAKEKLVV